MKLILASLLVMALLILPACTQPAEAPPSGTPPPATIAPGDAAAAWQVVSAYWEAFNNYDVEGTLSFLEESYRLEKEASIKSEIGQMQAYGVKLGVEEEAEPTLTAEGKVEIKIKLTTPVGAKHDTFDLTKINNEWKICLIVEE
jgi:hypothetical protein